MNDLPDPPEQESVRARVENLWSTIEANFEKGWPWRTYILLIEDAIRMQEARIVAGNIAPGFEWNRDLYLAKAMHDSRRDTFDLEQRRYNGLLEFWRNWVAATRKTCGEIGVEGLRTSVLVHGATILACLAALSGQYASTPSTKDAAICMFVFSLTGLICTIVGYGWSYSAAMQSADAVAAKLLDTMPYSELRSVGDVIHKTTLHKQMRVAEILIYASLAFFCFGAFFSAFILLS